MDLIEALSKARDRAGGPGARANLADVGNWLRKSGADLGEWKLSDLLRTAPEFGQIESGTVVFGDGAPPAGHEVAQRDVYTGATLRSDLFHAMVTDQPGMQAFMHVKTCEIEVVPLVNNMPGSPVAEADFEYVRVPTIRTVEQREFARDWLSDKVQEDALAYVLGGDDAGWVHRGRLTVAPQQWDEFWQARRSWIVRRAVDWLRAQRLPVERFVRTPNAERTRRSLRPSESSVRGDVPHEDGGPETRLKERVLAAVERMTLAELCELRIPARLLLDE